jgi:hypothetical protein
MRKLLGLVLLVPFSASAQSPFDGTWRMSLNSTQFAEETDVFALDNGEYTCSTCSPKITVKADGADHEVAGDKDYDTLAVKQVDDRAVKFTRKKAGKVVGESTNTVSPDGSTLTLEFKDYPPGGQPMTGEIIFARAAPGPKGAHAISGAWRTAKVEKVSERGLTMTFKSTLDGLSMDLPFTASPTRPSLTARSIPSRVRRGARSR